MEIVKDLSLQISFKQRDKKQFQNQVYFKLVLESWANIYESLDSQFLRITTRIQTGTEASEESLAVMIFLTTCGVTQLLYGLKIQGQISKTSMLKSFAHVIDVTIFRFIGHYTAGVIWKNLELATYRYEFIKRFVSNIT